VNQQDVRILVHDEIGVPMELTLMYWVEADHDLNRNGIADDHEYASKRVTNMSESKSKWFMTTIDHSRNPNMGRVSYYWSGGDQAGNPVFYTQYDDEGVLYNLNSGPGFSFDDATFQTRRIQKPSLLDWSGLDTPMMLQSLQVLSNRLPLDSLMRIRPLISNIFRSFSTLKDQTRAETHSEFPTPV
jgi:hypothetical protein